MDVSRLSKPTSWEMLKQQVAWVKQQAGQIGSLIIDTIDWAEMLCVESICATHQKNGVEDFGYGKGYIFVAEEIGRFLNLLSDVIEAGIHVVLTAHAQIVKFEQPDEMGAYDRYQLKLGQKTGSRTASLVKEWADMVLFINYKTFSIATDKEGKRTRHRAGHVLSMLPIILRGMPRIVRGCRMTFRWTLAILLISLTDPSKQSIHQQLHNKLHQP